MRKFETSNSSEEKSKIVFGEIESEKLLLLENSAFGNLQKSEEEQTSSSLPLIKRKHSRLTSAFRSFRGSRSGKTSKSAKLETDTAETPLQTSEEIPLVKEIVKESIKVQLTPKPKKKKSKLAKKFSLSAIRRHKVSPRKPDLGELVSSSTQTPINLNRHSSTPEGGNLNISQLSLVDFASHSGTELDSSPVKFEKVRKIQITISGKKIPRSRKSHSVTTTSSKGEEDYLTVVSEANSIEKSDTESSPQKKGETAAGETELSQYQQQEKINITESNRDTPPRERAPARPELSPQRSDSTDRSEPEGVGTGADASGKGAIRKNRLKRQKESIEIEEYMHREERGRRFPRPQANKHPTIETQQTLVADTEEVQRYHGETTTYGGNSVQNPNLSGLIADKSFDSTDQPLSGRATRIQFALGKEARGQVLRTESSESKDLSSIGSNRSSESQSPVSESSLARRRIRYVEQPTLYTDEEREILAGRRDGLTHLSGISEYSFDSEFSVETQMPAFGDLTMEEAPIMTSSSGHKREHLYKILVIGELGTGKTSFIKRYVHQFFSQNYRATIGVDFALKVLQWDQNTIVRLQLWDIAGQERFGNMTRVYYKEAVGAFIVFDVTRSGTFDCVSKWKEDLDSKVQLPDGSPIPCILLANKCDQEKQGIATTPEKMDEYVKENGFAGWFETSAKENVNINEAARALVNKILLNDKLISAADIMDSEKFALPGGNGGKSSQNKKSCSC